MKNFLLHLFLIPLSLNVIADINDYIYPNRLPSFSNYGTTGIIQMPSARLHDEGSLAVSWSHNEPYLRGSIIAYPFSWLEATYGYTDINNALYSNVPSFSGSQSYKDKGFDVKIRLLRETDLLPNIAIGIRDLAGSNQFEAEYLVASKFIKNIDFTLGLGWGDLSHGRYKNPLSVFGDGLNQRVSNNLGGQGGEFVVDRYFRGSVGLFGGIELYIPNARGLRFKVEYDSTNYLEEAFGLGRTASNFAFEPVEDTKSRMNFGFTYPVNRNFHLKASYVKGSTFNFGFSYALNLAKKNKKLKKINPPIPIENANIVRKVNTTNELFYYRSILNNLREREYYLQKASVDSNVLSVAFSQSTHASHMQAAGRVARVLDEISPENIKTFNLININAGMAMYSMEIDRYSFSKNMPTNSFRLAARDIKIQPEKYEDRSYKYNPSKPFPAHFYKIEPSLRTQIGGPDSFFFGDLRLTYEGEILFDKSLSLSTSASIGITDNLDSLKLASDSIIPHVRTDIVQYLKNSQKYNIDRVQLNYFLNPFQNIYGKFSFGLLETMFAGIGSEFLYRPFNKNYGVGAEIWRVQQRDYDLMFGLRDYKTTTGHINLYYIEPRSKIFFAIRGGKFLAKDSGLSFDFSRRFKSGFQLGAFFSRTDISKREFGEGSFDKGFYFHVPLDIFSTSYNKEVFTWGLKPLTRDGAAPLNHGYYLWGVTEQAHQETFFRDWDDLYD
jgi:hypothetical protein